MDQILEVIGACSQHRFFVLTKRPHNIDLMVYGVTLENPCRELGGGDYLPNLWIGVSVWDQKSADAMIPLLLQTPAGHRWVSYEPALGPVDFSPWLPGLDWIVMGGETGPGARPMHPDWARSVRDQCAAAAVPFFLKSLGKWYPRSEKLDCDTVALNQFGVLSADGEWDLNTTVWNTRDIDPDTREAYLISTPGRTAGRFLDGRTHDEVPE